MGRGGCLGKMRKEVGAGDPAKGGGQEGWNRGKGEEPGDRAGLGWDMDAGKGVGARGEDQTPRYEGRRGRGYIRKSVPRGLQ